MKIIKHILYFTILTLFITACSSDDDNSQDTANSLVGTQWFGTADDKGEIITFVNETEYTFSGDGVGGGTYTFDGTNGVLTEGGFMLDFTIVDNVMTVQTGVNDDSTSIYIRQ